MDGARGGSSGAGAKGNGGIRAHERSEGHLVKSFGKNVKIAIRKTTDHQKTIPNSGYFIFSKFWGGRGG